MKAAKPENVGQGQRSIPVPQSYPVLHTCKADIPSLSHMIFQVLPACSWRQAVDANSEGRSADRRRSEETHINSRLYAFSATALDQNQILYSGSTAFVLPVHSVATHAHKHAVVRCCLPVQFRQKHACPPAHMHAAPFVQTDTATSTTCGVAYRLGGPYDPPSPPPRPPRRSPPRSTRRHISP